MNPVPKSELRVIVPILCLGFVCLTPLYSQENEVAGSDGSKQVYGAERSSPEKSEVPANPFTDSPISEGRALRVLLFLVVAAIGLGIAAAYMKKRGIDVKGFYGGNKDGRLMVSETRMLGNRQYLMVVQYNRQKMLLGVCPGNIQHLCFLDTSFDETVGKVVDEQANAGKEVSG